MARMSACILQCTVMPVRRRNALPSAAQLPHPPSAHRLRRDVRGPISVVRRSRSRRKPRRGCRRCGPSLARRGLSGFILPRADRHQNEYVPPSEERLAWLTGFTGSAGTGVVLGRPRRVVRRWPLHAAGRSARSTPRSSRSCRSARRRRSAGSSRTCPRAPSSATTPGCTPSKARSGCRAPAATPAPR